MRGFELIFPLFDGAIIRPLREGAKVEGVESDLAKSYGVVLRTVDTICNAVSGESCPIDPTTEVPGSSADNGHPPRAPRDPSASLMPDDHESARMTPV